MNQMMDIQKQPDYRNVYIQKVGVKNINYPVIVLDRANSVQHTVATINMYVDLPHQFKGTHMSRFIEILNEHHGAISPKNFLDIIDDLLHLLEAKSAHMEVEFPYFIEKKAPVSEAKSLMEYRCSYIGAVNGATRNFLVGIRVPINTLCPCSKEISERGAHNQRGWVTVTLKFEKFFWIEDVIALIEESASCGIYALLKREDEKYLTERAYDNPMFVEDVVREVAKKLNADPNFTWFSIEAENFESIHNHSAYAYVERAEEIGTDSK